MRARSPPPCSNFSPGLEEDSSNVIGENHELVPHVNEENHKLVPLGKEENHKQVPQRWAHPTGFKKISIIF